MRVVVWISALIGVILPVMVPESTGCETVTVGAGVTALLPGTTIWDPQRLQNPEPSGTRLPHREQ
jgi:hypothetical protein